MRKEYLYQCKDNSIITPIFKKTIVAPIMKFVPRAVPANIITLISNFFLYIALFISFHFSEYNKLKCLFIAILIFLYAIGDHIDGMQASRTKTGSALGEFCDHYLDFFNNGILIVLLINLFKVDSTLIIVSFVLSSYLAHSAIIFEEYKTKWLIFETFGSLEAILIAILIFLSASFKPIYELYLFPILGGFNLIELMFIFSFFGALGTLFKALLRIRRELKNFIIFSLILFALTIFLLMFQFNFWELFLIISLYSALYTGNLMYGHLVDGIERKTDFLIFLIFLLLYYLNHSTSTIFIISFTYLFLKILYLIIKTFYILRNFWVWKNPTPDCT